MSARHCCNSKAVANTNTSVEDMTGQFFQRELFGRHFGFLPLTHVASQAGTGVGRVHALTQRISESGTLIVLGNYGQLEIYGTAYPNFVCHPLRHTTNPMSQFDDLLAGSTFSILYNYLTLSKGAILPVKGHSPGPAPKILSYFCKLSFI